MGVSADLLPCAHLSAASPASAGDAHDAATEDVVVIINNPISLLCEAPAYPPPSITWLKDEVPIEASRDVRLLPGTAPAPLGLAPPRSPFGCPGGGSGVCSGSGDTQGDEKSLSCRR